MLPLRGSGLKALEHLGNGFVWIPASLALALLGRTSQAAAAGRTALAALLGDLLLVGLLKAAVRRRRPPYNAGDMHIAVAVDKHSFPSGVPSRVAPQTMSGPQHVPTACGL